MGNCQNIQKDSVKGVYKVQPFSLIVTHYTWQRDSHGLFDYESNNIIKGVIKSNKPQVELIRLNDAIKISQSQDEVNVVLFLVFFKKNQNPSLIRLHKKIQSYYINMNPQIEGSLSVEDDDTGLAENSIWLIVKSLISKDGNQTGYKMVEGDQIKLGRVRFRIREIKISENDLTPKKSLQKVISEKNLCFKHVEPSRINTLDVDECKSSISQSAQICRICLGESECDNPLLDPCLCQGSVKYIHLQCLQKWLGNKLGAKTTKFSVSFVWKKFECEICKSEFPNVIERNGCHYETVEIPKPSIPYITLEILSREKNISKGTHIISLQQKTAIKLGRGHDSDVRITDISVSRFHATIKFEKNSFILEDNRSKFGTLVLMKNTIQIGSEDHNTIAVQVGRSVLQFSLKKDWKIGSCCLGGPISKEDLEADADEVQQIQQGDRDSILMTRQMKTRVLDNGQEVEEPREEEDAQAEEPENEQPIVQNQDQENFQEIPPQQQ